MIAGRVQLEDQLHNWLLLFINVNGPGKRIIPVAEGSAPWINSLCSFLTHALLHFFFQVLHIVLRNSNVDVMHELVLRTGVLADDPAFFDKMDFDSALFDQRLECKGVCPVAIEAVRLLDEHDPIRAVRQLLEHLCEVFATRILGGLNIDELAINLESPRAGIFGQQLALCRN